MIRYLKQLYFLQLVFTILFFALPTVVGEQVVIDTENPHGPTVEVGPGQGPSAADLNEAITQTLNLCQVRDAIRDARYRVLSPRFLDDGIKTPNNGYQAAVYDYTNARTLHLSGTLFDPTTVSVTETNEQPFPNAEEIAEAGRIAGAQSNEVVSNSMPPVETTDFPNGTSHRLLNIAITSASSSRIVQVNMNNRMVEHPPTISQTEEPMSCSAPGPEFGTVITNQPGEVNLVIKQGGNVLWTFRAIRPAASSGHEGSGIELRDVRYKKKLVLFQAHVPVLNVEYPPPATCGPTYRDWQNWEWPFKCDLGTPLGSGFRLCKSPPKTILESNKDSGDFTGVAVYVDGQEVVLKSQLKAGWYRYVSEWRFHVDGTLKPRFGFGAVLEGDRCVCQPHHHHVYWRFDFDIVTAGNNLVREFNDPSNYHEKIFEIRRPKDNPHHRRWEISNMRTHDAYTLIPGANDGSSSAFGVGDLWVLKYRGTELDDYLHPTDKEDIDRFVNKERVKDTDVVLWYGAHFKHVESFNLEGVDSDHVVGPDIRPVRW